MRFLLASITGFLLVLGVLSILPSTSGSTNGISPSPSTPPTATPAPEFFPPTNDYQARITKKPFGLYVSPQNSPVNPEHFTGYHTGIDIEYDDADSEIPVFSISSGQVVYSGYVNGYGGLVIVSFLRQDQPLLALYGHLNPANLPKNKSEVSRGQRLGFLGRGYTSETDWERKHLHLAVLKGSQIDFRGYVTNKNDLKHWINPLDLF